MVTIIQNWGNSQGIRIPKAFLESMNIQCNDAVEMILDGDKLIIKKKISLKDLFTDYTKTTVCSEYDWGQPQGKEVW